VDVRDVDLGVARRPDRADGLALGDVVAGADDDRSQMEKCHGVRVGRPDRDRPPVAGQPARERDAPGGRRPDGLPGLAADVDAAVAVLVVVLAAEVEAPQDRSVGRPAPANRGRRCS
jgi:hypothetical protein